ncbi:MAG: hypothetical protein WCO99_01470, partial [Planctomycetota bacterium]
RPLTGPTGVVKRAATLRNGAVCLRGCALTRPAEGPHYEHGAGTAHETVLRNGVFPCGSSGGNTAG